MTISLDTFAVRFKRDLEDLERLQNEATLAAAKVQQNIALGRLELPEFTAFSAQPAMLALIKLQSNLVDNVSHVARVHRETRNTFIEARAADTVTAGPDEGGECPTPTRNVAEADVQELRA